MRRGSQFLKHCAEKTFAYPRDADLRAHTSLRVLVNWCDVIARNFNIAVSNILLDYMHGEYPRCRSGLRIRQEPQYS